MDEILSASIERFQIIYTKSKDIRIKIIVKNNKYTPETEVYFRRFTDKNFNNGTKVTFEYVQNIAPHISGKYQMVVWE